MLAIVLEHLRQVLLLGLTALDDGFTGRGGVGTVVGRGGSRVRGPTHLGQRQVGPGQSRRTRRAEQRKWTQSLQVAHLKESLRTPWPQIPQGKSGPGLLSMPPILSRVSMRDLVSLMRESGRRRGGGGGDMPVAVTTTAEKTAPSRITSAFFLGYVGRRLVPGGPPGVQPPHTPACSVPGRRGF